MFILVINTKMWKEFLQTGYCSLNLYQSIVFTSLGVNGSQIL